MTSDVDKSFDSCTEFNGTLGFHGDAIPPCWNRADDTERLDFLLLAEVGELLRELRAVIYALRECVELLYVSRAR